MCPCLVHGEQFKWRSAAVSVFCNEELVMSEVRKIGLALGLGLALLVLTGFGAKRYSAPNGTGGEAIARRIALLRSGKPQQKAAAAYWLGQQRAAAAGAVDSLVDLLGDATEVDPTQYRQRPLDKMTLGEEVAAALVNIGHPAIEPLIHVLKTSPQAEARKNAAWALGALHDTGATSSEI
jgi:HEAT repeat protein